MSTRQEGARFWAFGTLFRQAFFASSGAPGAHRASGPIAMISKLSAPQSADLRDIFGLMRLIMLQIVNFKVAEIRVWIALLAIRRGDQENLCR